VRLNSLRNRGKATLSRHAKWLFQTLQRRRALSVMRQARNSSSKFIIARLKEEPE
jgi:hypothetical protein